MMGLSQTPGAERLKKESMIIKSLYVMCAALSALACLSAGPLSSAAQAHSPEYEVLYHFNQSTNGEGFPEGSLVESHGTLYGTVTSGGSANLGTFFGLDLSTLVETTLYSFPGGRKQGEVPRGPLTRVGNIIYGSTPAGYGFGLPYGHGTIWRFNTRSGQYHLFHGFKPGEGTQPYSGVTPVDGNFYGTTLDGGAGNTGTVFELDATGKLNQLYSFPDSAIGCNPMDTVILVGNVLFGTATLCGANGAGTVYALDLGSGTVSVLHSFAANQGRSVQPYALVYQDGALYGTTQYEGGAGTVYKIVLQTGRYSVLHQFSGGTDGKYPSSGLTAFHGKLYGVTTFGGEGLGTIYRIDPNSGSQTVVHNFTSGANGDEPLAGLMASGGALYGTTLNVSGEYPNIHGALFKFTP